MKRFALAAAVIAAALWIPSASAFSAEAPANPTGTATWSVDSAEKAEPTGPRADRLNWRERRKLGITASNIRRIVQDLDKADQIDPQDTASASVAVLTVLMDENQAAYAALSPQFDWDKLLEAIERIIELVMRIIGLFSYAPVDLDAHYAHAPPPPAYNLAA